ncbi:uncharacterized protein [Antedon mediterranea]|uniref:uncharacterized protein n=1 Tax=Antedon mediterranea TaxID=105859 RepID=UPI003AF5EE76
MNLSFRLWILAYCLIIKRGESRRNSETKVHTLEADTDDLTSTPVSSPSPEKAEDSCSYTFKVSSLSVSENTCGVPKNDRRCSHKKVRSLQKNYSNMSLNVLKLEKKVKSLEERLELQTEVIKNLQKHVYTEGLYCDRMTGWIRYNNSCYWFSPRDYQTSWWNAIIICNSLNQGASLAVLNDEQEAGFVLAHADMVDRQSFWWIGCRRKSGQVREWTCVDDSALGFTRWSTNRPTSYPNERCLQLWNLPRMEFTDTQCNQKWAFVCERKMNELYN